MKGIAVALLLLLVSAASAGVASAPREWDYVALGDSITSWVTRPNEGMIPRYAAMIERDLSVKVTIQNRTIGDLHSSVLLRLLREDRELQRALREAEIVTFNVPMNVFAGPILTFTSGGKCGGADNQDCLREALRVYEADTAAIIAEIVALRSPSQALMRTMDTYQFMVKSDKARGAFPVIKTYWQAVNKRVIAVATHHRIPVARVYAAFMGPDGDDDPIDKGLVLPDEFHTTSRGADLLAQLFRELGYQYAAP